MKTSRLSLSLGNSKNTQKNSPNRKSVPYSRTSSTLNSQPIIPFLKSRLNKQLKYYSTRNKQHGNNLPDNKLQGFQQSFNNFNYVDINILIKNDQTEKKYCENYCTKNSFRPTQSSLATQVKQIGSTANCRKKQNQKKGQFAVNINSFEFQDSKLRYSERSINSFKITQFNPLLQDKTKYKECEPNCGNPEEVSKVISQEQIQSPSTKQKNQTKKVMITEQRLKRHRFNKSSITKINNFQSKFQSYGKVENESKIMSRSHNCLPQQSFIHFVKLNIEKFHQKQKTFENLQKSKRYITIRGQTQQKDKYLDPITRQKYLYCKFKDQVQQINKKGNKMSHFSPNMQFYKFYLRTKYVLIKTLNSQTSTINSQKNYQKTNRQQMLRRIKDLRKTKVRNQFKQEKFKLNKNVDKDQIKGWQVV